MIELIYTVICGMLYTAPLWMRIFLRPALYLSDEEWTASIKKLARIVVVCGFAGLVLGGAGLVMILRDQMGDDPAVAVATAFSLFLLAVFYEALIPALDTHEGETERVRKTEQRRQRAFSEAHERQRQAQSGVQSLPEGHQQPRRADRKNGPEGP